MTIFEQAKALATAREAAEYYGGQKGRGPCLWPCASMTYPHFQETGDQIQTRPSLQKVVSVSGPLVEFSLCNNAV